MKLPCPTAAVIVLALNSWASGVQNGPPDDAQRADSGRGVQAKDSSGQQSIADYGFGHPEPLNGTIGTGRPSFSTGTTAVPIGRFQFETGVTYNVDDNGVPGDAETTVFPNLLVRTGVSDHVELRFSTSGYVDRDPGESGFADISLGTKIEVLVPDDDDPAWLPRLAVQPSVSIPTGSASPSDQLDPRVQVAASWPLGESTGLLTNFNVGTSSVGTETATTIAGSVLVSQSLGDRLGVYAEIYHLANDSGPDTTTADVGVLYLLSDNVQIDAVVGAGLTREATDLFVGTGLSFRF